ncbi:phosphotransferase [Streptomyces roseifaciens]|uniref:phosphotransferase n=1 Tax=Streptomyces roseifaciens TaxID=1488406 RepID=UPI0007181FE7|nr:phosphotransferase [Streptomyces roseifaciens]
MTSARFTKNYASARQAAAASRHYHWLAAHARPLLQPALMATAPTSLTFAWIDGRHAEPHDLPRLAGMLGDAHGAAWTSDLHRASLAVPCTSRDGAFFPDYVACREVALRKRLEQGHLPDSSVLDMLLALLEETAEGPVAFYKDSNPRNFLITTEGTIFTVDTDDLTLAPFGYDLAKLITTLIMTHGPIEPPGVEQALDLYNEAASRHNTRLAAIDLQRLHAFLALHVHLTAPYAGRNGYRFGVPGFGGST